MADRKRSIIPLKDFLTIVPTIYVRRSESEGCPLPTSAACKEIVDLKLRKDEIEAQDKPLRALILSALKDLGFDGVEVPFSTEYSYTIAIVEKENKTISAELLLEAGVDPAVIAKCTKTTPSTYLEARAKKLR